MNRRRFLTLSAAFACAPALARADTWSGIALGAEVSVTLYGSPDQTGPMLSAIPRRLRQIEQTFSLYEPSELTRLNERGLAAMSPEFAHLIDLCDQAHGLTGGLFDSTIQSRWSNPQARTGWQHTSRNGRHLTLGAGQSLTLNGIAQGHATDLIRADLQAAGADKALINIGEYAALSGPFHMGISDPVQGIVGQTSLTGTAVATSSPSATLINGAPHITGPMGEHPLWSTVSITADSAAMADALSTAACMMPLTALRALKRQANLHKITVLDADGNLRTL
ncbi:FAD:protein FMN transferase [Donghicola eburneus]|uniref:FAD:protein FMN transferase n=1 Tax=Donghicola eburneus TaxID=393278 RepID=A0A1M4MZM3_9RHOB|nr:FAD:protein FMN transferase [Donghicola eburneus]SCM68052.1 nitrous-oxide reductase protein NosX [Donghicola eburneus]SFQ52846.1 thiamine biosynthesis lipoprotein [Donghicola eburneus]